MPELPEIETVRAVIGEEITGACIREAEVRAPSLVAWPTAEEFCRRLRGRTITSLTRRGKFLVFSLDDGGRMLLHLRMTGCLLAAQAGEPEEKHTHLVFTLTDGRALRFSDVRRFGRVWLFAAGETDAVSGIESLGRDALDPSIDGDCLKTMFGKRRTSIKECLLDQRALCGIGNIYSDEILFAARIHPARPACLLTDDEWTVLAEAIGREMAYFVEKNAVSAEEYRRGHGMEYHNTPYLRVYGRAGEACLCCGAPLVRSVIGGRGSVWCPRCQKENV